MMIKCLLHQLPTSVQVETQIVSNKSDPSDQQNLSPAASAHNNTSELAIEALESFGRHAPTPLIPLPDCTAYLLHKGQYITGGEELLLQTRLRQKRIQQHIQKRNNWTNETQAKVDWEAFQAARRKYTNHRFTTRFIHGWLPTRQRLHRYHHAPNDK